MLYFLCMFTVLLQADYSDMNNTLETLFVAYIMCNDFSTYTTYWLLYTFIRIK